MSIQATTTVAQEHNRLMTVPFDSNTSVEDLGGGATKREEPRTFGQVTHPKKWLH
eukprot:m.445250 g.445250  ORF g.445250 m.445250 type:complete len:55 (-) comp19199_c0_seq1:16-180(-)